MGCQRSDSVAGMRDREVYLGNRRAWDIAGSMGEEQP